MSAISVNNFLNFYLKAGTQYIRTGHMIYLVMNFGHMQLEFKLWTQKI